MKPLFLICLAFLTATFTAPGQNKKTFSNLTEASNGYIGIGTEIPDQMLTVKGSIHTQEVLVDLDGAVAPDYVFENYFEGYSTLKPDYRMPELAALEAFVKEHHHLPGAPSAADMETEGMPLKKMNLLLLEKVEELLLHTIAQQKQIDELKARLEALEAKGSDE